MSQLFFFKETVHLVFFHHPFSAVHIMKHLTEQCVGRVREDAPLPPDKEAKESRL
jgi:hypothetical protein